MKPQFKELKFPNEIAFKIWLDHHWYWMISLYDYKQDLSTIWIHKTGEILACDFSESVYIGKFVDVSFIRRDQPLKIFNTNTLQYDTYKGLVIKNYILNHKNI